VFVPAHSCHAGRVPRPATVRTAENDVLRGSRDRREHAVVYAIRTPRGTPGDFADGRRRKSKTCVHARRPFAGTNAFARPAIEHCIGVTNIYVNRRPGDHLCRHSTYPIENVSEIPTRRAFKTNYERRRINESLRKSSVIFYGRLILKRINILGTYVK